MAPEPILYRARLGWRRRSIWALVGLRRPLAEHTREEGEFLRRHAAGASCVVELGVAEGGSAWELRHAMSDDGILFLVDPYPPGALGFNVARAVARRLLRRVPGAKVVWVGARSHDAAIGWTQPIDFLLVDADHSYDAVSEDWVLWSPHVRVGGRVAFHDARPCEWTGPNDGPVRLMKELRGRPQWRELGHVDSTVVLEKLS